MGSRGLMSDEKEILRFYHGMDYVYQDTIDMLLNKAHFMLETGLDDMSDVSDIQDIIDSNLAVFHKTDKWGRPVFYF